MPEMTTLPIFQSAPPVASSPQTSSGTAALPNSPDAPGPAIAANVPTTASTANTTTVSDPGTGAQAGSDAASFANVLRHQLAQTRLRGTPAPDVALLPILASLPQSVSGAVPALSGQPVSVEALLSDLSDLAARSSPQGGKPVPVAVRVSDVELPTLPVATLAPGTIAKPVAVADPAPDAASQVAGPTAQKKDDVAQEMPVDGLASLLQYIPAPGSSAAVKRELGTPATEKKPAAAPASGLIPGFASATPIQAPLDGGKAALPAPTTELPLATASKSAEFAAAPASSTDIAQTHDKPSQSIDPEKSFENLLGAALATGQNHSVHAPGNQAAMLPVQTTVGAHGWDGEVADKVVWMVGRHEQRAELVLYPPEMGRVEVSLSMRDGQTSAQFVSANPAVRDALEAALPRLRETLADAGVNLGQTQVGAGTGNNAGNPSTNNPENRDNSGRSLSRDELLSSGSGVLRPIEAPQWLKRANSLVDLFA